MTPATRAREEVGLSLEDVAARARISPAYLRQIEHGRGTGSYVLVTRLARIVGCSANVYLYSKPKSRRGTQDQAKQQKGLGKR